MKTLENLTVLMHKHWKMLFYVGFLLYFIGFNCFSIGKGAMFYNNVFTEILICGQFISFFLSKINKKNDFIYWKNN